jgi:hypothetical protein
MNFAEITSVRRSWLDAELVAFGIAHDSERSIASYHRGAKSFRPRNLLDHVRRRSKIQMQPVAECAAGRACWWLGGDVAVLPCCMAYRISSRVDSLPRSAWLSGDESTRTAGPPGG